MKQLHFTRNGNLLIATEGPHRYVLYRTNIKSVSPGWTADIYEREGRRTPKLTGHFRSKSEAINWMGRYRSEDLAHG